MITMKKTLFALIAVLSSYISGCVTVSNTYQDSIPEEDRKEWEKNVEKKRSKYNQILKKQLQIVSQKLDTNLHIWEVKKGSKTSYILGTAHRHVYLSQFPPHFESCITKANTVILESGGQNDYTSEQIRQRDERAKRLNQPSVRSIGSPTWERFQSSVLPVDPELYQDLDIGTALEFYFTAMDQLIHEDSSSMDDEIALEAQKFGKKVMALDDTQVIAPTIKMLEEERSISVDGFKKIFEADPFEKYLERSKQQLDSVVKYVEFPTDKMASAAELMFNKTSYENMISTRNQSWVNKLAVPLEQGNSFIAVGFAHMVGKDSLLTLLKSKGYQVSLTKRCSAFEKITNTQREAPFFN